MVGHPLGWAASGVLAAIAFLISLAWALSPGQSTGLGFSRGRSGDSVAAVRFAERRMPAAGGLQPVAVVRASASASALSGPLGGSASIGTRDATEPLQVNAAAFSEWVRSPRNVPSTAVLSNPGNPVRAVISGETAAARTGPYVANYAPTMANGVATWYGGSFHGNVTYCGKIFDMYDPTIAASTDFPCGTWLTVTNVSNGATIMVQVMDRGLLGPGHVDLSLAAFSAIAHPSQGTIGVTVSNWGW